MPRAATWKSLLVLSLLWIAPAPAQGGTADDPSPARGREESSAVEVEDVALSLPRALLAFPRMATRLLFLPARALLDVMSRHDIPERIVDLLYNDERTAAIHPTLSAFTSQGVTVGASAFHEGLGRHGERVEASVRFGGRFVHSIGFQLEAPHVAGSRFSVEALSRLDVEPRLRFHGVGQEAPDRLPDRPVGPREAQVETVFEQRRSLLRLRAGRWITDHLDVGVVGIYNVRDFEAEEEGGAPPLVSVYDPDRLPGFDGYALVEPLLDLRLDTRAPAGLTSRGVYAHAMFGGSPGPEFHFAHLAAELAGFIDLRRGDRVLVLRAAHEAVLADSDAEVPFADLPRLGGSHRLRGYDLDRFRDLRTVLATVEYRWPIHPYAGAVVFVDAGRVGRDYEALVRVDEMRLGIGGGLEFRSRNVRLFTLQVAHGEGVHVYLTTDPLAAYGDRTEQL